MQTRNKWFSLCAVSGVLSGLIICGGDAEEVVPRSGCGCGQSSSGQSETPAPADTEKRILVCPQYVWMEWGTYCSYYAQIHQLCDPVNLDHENCQLAVGDCETGTNCVSVGGGLLENRTPLVGGQLGVTGYPGNKAARRAAGAPIPGSSSDLTVTNIDSFVIKFPVRGANAAYAQIFIVRVVPKGASPPAVLARGLEISTHGLLVDEVRHDYTTAVPTGTHVHKQPPVPVKGQGRHFHYRYGMLTIPVIMHHQTPPHGE